MKKVFYLIIVLITSLIACNAQNKVYDNPDGTQLLKEGDYVKDDRIDKYIGTWEWKNGNEIFTIVIKKITRMKWDASSVIHYYDYAVGWHKYTKNGKIIENTMDKVNTKIVRARDMTGTTFFSGSTTPKYLSGLLENSDRKLYARVTLTFLPGKTDELQWQIYNKNTTIPGKQESYTIPVNMVLKKVKTVSGIGGGFGSIVVQ